MKEDYLWDKTGDDPEIKGFENELAAFRYRETDPVFLLAVAACPVVEKPQRRKISLAFAFAAACPTAIVIMLGVWFTLSDTRSWDDGNVAITKPTNGEIEGNEIGSLPVKTIETENRRFRQNVLKIRHVGSPTLRRKKVAARISDLKKQIVELTNEEKFAYGQLMLALSVTGSTLKIVKDRIDGIDDDKIGETKNGL